MPSCVLRYCTNNSSNTSKCKGVTFHRWGRKPSLIISVVGEVIVGIAAAYMPEFWSFTFARMIIGATQGGILVVGFVIVTEYVGSDIRPLLAAGFHLPFTFGHMMIAGFAYFLRNWRHLQLAISVANSFLVAYICILPESPQWLLATDKKEKAVTLLTKIAKINKRPTDLIQQKVEEHLEMRRSTGPAKKGTVADLFRMPRMRKRMLVMCFVWFSCSFSYYGMSQYISHLTGNIFINVVASAAVCTISTLVTMPIIGILKRKLLIIICQGICGISLVLIAIIPDGTFSVVLACSGMLFGYTAFIVIYLHCTEMFPTVVRNAAMGISSMTARIGAMVAPFIIDLKVYGKWCAPLIFGILPLIAAVLSLILPETKGLGLMTTIEEGEALGLRAPSEPPASTNPPKTNET